MDTNVAGLNKVYCFVNSSSLNGRTVEITDGVNTWTNTISSLSCVFMIPSMPAPAKRTYTVSLLNSGGTAAEYSRQIELGFGDSVRIGLYTGDEVVKKGAIPVATSELVGGVKINDSISNGGIYLDGNNKISLRTATSLQKGGMKVASNTSYGVRMNGDTLQTYEASTSQSGCIKIGDGLQMSNGVASVKYADGSNVGGIMIGNGLQMVSGVAKVKPSTGLVVDSDGVKINTGRDSAYIENNISVPANDVVDASVVFTDATVIRRLEDGVVYGVNVNNTHVIASIRRFTKQTDKVTVYLSLCNPTGSSKLVESISIYYYYPA